MAVAPACVTPSVLPRRLGEPRLLSVAPDAVDAVAQDGTGLGVIDPPGPSPRGERRRDDPPTRRCSFPRQMPRVGPWPNRQRRGNGSSPHWNVKVGSALSRPFGLGEKLGVAEVGRPDFEILGGLVIILRQQSERHFQIVLPRHVGQLPEMVCSVATIGNVDHPPKQRGRLTVPTQRLARLL
jgi:hypothetical protein